MIKRIHDILKKRDYQSRKTGVLTIILCVAEEGRIITNLLTRDLNVVVIGEFI